MNSSRLSTCSCSKKTNLSDRPSRFTGLTDSKEAALIACAHTKLRRGTAADGLALVALTARSTSARTNSKQMRYDILRDGNKPWSEVRMARYWEGGSLPLGRRCRGISRGFEGRQLGTLYSREWERAKSAPTICN